LFKNYKYIIILGIILILILLFNYNYKIIIVSGESMRSTYSNNDILIANKRYKDLEVEDIVVFKYSRM